MPRKRLHPPGPVGRPPKFKPEFVEQVRKIAAQFGATDGDAAVFFEVNCRTITRWKHDYPEFAKAFEVAKDVADARVEQALYQRAIGYNHDAVKIFLPKDSRVPVIVPYVAHVPPDPASMIWWLKNRKRDQWRDRLPLDGATDEDGALRVKIVNDPDAEMKSAPPDADGNG